MKWMVASDIHGSAYYCQRMLEAFDRERADRLLLLGDLLYHGPRNDLPKDYNPKSVIEMLNARSDVILCVRGNCDAEVDQMVLQFPIMADYAVLCLDGQVVYATHGHIYGEENPPKLKRGEILLCGHTHVPKCVKHGGFIYMNPGSAALPKEGSHHGYMIIEAGEYLWKDFEGEVKERYQANCN